MTRPLLEVRHLSVELQTQRGPALAVRDVSFSLAAGETLGVVGESGSGKSLTAMALLGLLPEQARVSGSIVFDGQELLGQPEPVLRALRGDRIGMVFQEPMTALNPVHTIGHQVAEPLRLHRGMGRSQARAEAIALLDRVGIPEAARRIDAYPHQFSGGQRQRVTIAMALACRPQLLIADEPTTALDVTLQRQILDLIRGLVQERGMALLLVSHDLGVIARNVQRVLVMYGGAVVESGPTASVFADATHPYTLGLLAARPGLRMAKGQRLATIPGTVPELVELTKGCPFAGRCAWTISECGAVFPPGYEVGVGHRARCIRLDVVSEAKRSGTAAALTPTLSPGGEGATTTRQP
ncbi:ABC transporter ATP-binding protein [Ramlibacter sp.]|uniref:ABC transporter ATP-binding protein n=1 Tax=Ramlibacter sp. TaxID=1917967 RepID=UPI002637E592|nr:ABC transporter ATP-binding protein [Ramlibacter sp.]MDB5954574.1 putative type dipeptide/oligopeptide transport system, ATP-binding component [Ramlibacter sp.]